MSTAFLSPSFGNWQLSCCRVALPNGRVVFDLQLTVDTDPSGAFGASGHHRVASYSEAIEVAMWLVHHVPCAAACNDLDCIAMRAWLVRARAKLRSLLDATEPA